MEETDIKYTMIQMVEGEPEKEGHDLEEPFDEEFWLKVSHMMKTSALKSAVCSIVSNRFGR